MKTKEPSMLKRILKDIKPIAGYLVIVVFISLCIVGFSVLIPELLGNIINLLYKIEDQTLTVMDIIHPTLFLLLIYVLEQVFSYLNTFILNQSVSRVFTCNLRISISDKIQRLPVSFVDKTPTGEIIDNIQEDVSTLGNSIHQIIEVIITGFLNLIVLSVFMFLKDWRLSLIVVTLTPLTIWLSSWLAGKGEKYWHDMFHDNGKIYSIIEESYTNFPATKSFNLEQRLNERHKELTEKRKNVSIRANFYSSMVQPIISFINNLIYIILALIGGYLIIKKQVKVGDVVTLILFAKQFSQPIEMIAYTFGNVLQIKTAAKRVYKLLDTEEEIRPTEDIGAVNGHVVFDHVSFSYKPEKQLIQNLSMDVQPGKTVAIVGPTGAGKTTLVNLLMRFYDIQEGRITIDGTDTSTVSRDSIRDLFGMVLQDTWLFNGTIADNVAYGKPDATREEIQHACDLCYCDHFIRSLPQGYDTIISDDSSTISSGQKQLLTIARALLANKQLLILDEATSNVDTRTEILIQKAMDRLMKGRTAFVIAHRLSTIVHADVILVMKNGQIIEQGTHEELMKQKGFYHELFESQYSI